MLARLVAIALIAASPTAAGEFFTLRGHGGPIMDIAVGPEGEIATASFDNAVGLWREEAPRWLDGHRAAVNAVAFLPDGTLVSGGDDFALTLWRDGAAVRLEGHQGKIAGLAASPDGAWIASASWDGSIGIWPRNGGAPRFLKGHANGVNDVAFARDGRLFSASSDGTIRVWDVEAGEETRLFLKHGFGVNRLVLQDDWLAYGAVDGGTRVVEATSGEPIADLTLERRPILSMAYGAGQLAVGDGEGFIMVVDTASWRIARDFRATRRGPVWALAFSVDGENIHAGGLDDIVYSWPVATMDAYDRMGEQTRSFLEDPNTLPNGERQFKRKCSICHTLTKGSARKAGPSLYALFGRRAGTVSDYSYSSSLDGSAIVWNETTIDALFNEGPEHYIPGTKMPMQRITGAQDRADLISFLRQATAP